MGEKTSNGVKIESSWKEALKDEFGQDYFKELREFVKGNISTQSCIPRRRIFSALLNCARSMQLRS